LHLRGEPEETTTTMSDAEANEIRAAVLEHYARVVQPRNRRLKD
jgi:hypothetical protein